MVTSQSPLKVKGALKANTPAVPLVLLLLGYLQHFLSYNTISEAESFKG